MVCLQSFRLSLREAGEMSLSSFSELCACFSQQLAGILGDYVDGITPESLNMSIGLRSGAADLTNLRIKQGVRAVQIVTGSRGLSRNVSWLSAGVRQA